MRVKNVVAAGLADGAKEDMHYDGDKVMKVEEAETSRSTL